MQGNQFIMLNDTPNRVCVINLSHVVCITQHGPSGWALQLAGSQSLLISEPEAQKIFAAMPGMEQ